MTRKLKLDMPTTGSKIGALDTDENLIQKLKCTEVELKKMKLGHENTVLKFALQISKAYDVNFGAFIILEGEF